ncbi:methionyl-tRNA formyltransferase [Ningiella sp. W23]|uniref:methionyl-tRNA formyltransferase n=1 Tax=Ningiella sp. W23 TaxID=3023715 RepID=UPI00375669C6
MKLIFAGTPDFAAAHLKALLASDHEILAVYTQPDRPSGRGKKLHASAVKTLALSHQIPVEQPENFKSEQSVDTLKNYHADLMVVVAYGLLLPKGVLDAPTKGCINVHGSLLPRWRGAAPIQRAIWAGDSHSGVAIMQMDEGLDTGPVLLEKTIPIEKTDTSASLYTKLAELGPVALLAALASYEQLEATTQSEVDVTYAKKLSKDEAKCDWSLPCAQLERNVRSFNPWPYSWFMHNNDAIKIHTAETVEQKHSSSSFQNGQVIAYSKEGLDIQCKDGILRVKQLQLPGKKKQNVAELINGKPNLFTSGQQLS